MARYNITVSYITHITVMDVDVDSFSDVAEKVREKLNEQVSAIDNADKSATVELSEKLIEDTAYPEVVEYMLQPLDDKGNYNEDADVIVLNSDCECTQ